MSEPRTGVLKGFQPFPALGRFMIVKGCMVMPHNDVTGSRAERRVTAPVDCVRVRGLGDAGTQVRAS